MQLLRLSDRLRTAWQRPIALDDAYFFVRYADHFLDGRGLAWNAGEPPAYGCTSLLHAFWIVLLRRLTQLAPHRVLAIGSWIPAVLALVVMGLACARAARHAPLLRRPLVAIGFACLCTAPWNGYLFHSTTGMDTTLSILVNSVLIWIVLGTRFAFRPAAACSAAAAAYLAFLCRPDALLLGGLFPLLVLWCVAPREAPRGRQAALFVGVLIALLGIDAAVKSAVFGHPLPLSFFIKNGEFYEGFIGARDWNPIGYMRMFIRFHLIPVGLLMLTISRRTLPLVVAALLPVALTWAYLATATQVMGFAARFYYPCLPFIVVAAWHALNSAAGSRAAHAGRGPRVRAWVARAAALGVAAAGLFPLSARAADWYQARVKALHPDLLRPGHFEPAPELPFLGWGVVSVMADFVRRCPSQAVWAMSEHGFVGAAAPQVTIIDLTGLHDRKSLSGEMTVERLLARRPDAIWGPHRAYTGMLERLLSHPAFREQYDYWPGAFDWGLAIRRDGPHRGAIDEAMRAAWQACYGLPRPPAARPRDGA